MDTKLLDYIKELSIKDKKGLAEKGLKAGEEFGELAKSILPYVSAYGTRHRFVDKYKILDCVADNILTALSVAYDVGFTHEEIESMISKKAIYWEGLQKGEDEANYPVPYEIHITVEANSEPKFIEHFCNICNILKVKPIVLDLENSNTVIKDVMTSSKFRGDNRTVYEEACRIKESLTKLGYNVVREKIESAPWHPGAPKKEEQAMPANCYFESHIAVEIDTTNNSKNILLDIAKQTDAHLSKNIFKKITDGRYIQMLTIRDYKTYRNKFEDRVKSVTELLNKHSFSTPKTEVEFCIYDSKVNHDYMWFKKEETINHT